LVFTRQGPEYRCNGRKVNQRAAHRLIDYCYVVIDSPGLFPDGPAQCWRARPARFPQMREGTVSMPRAAPSRV
jgi:hypothetical protein